MLSIEQSKFLVERLEEDIEAYSRALKRVYTPMAKDTLNKRIEMSIEIKKTLIKDMEG